MRRILFAHPDQKLTEIYTSHIRSHFGVDSVTDGLAAVRHLKLHSPIAIVSDYELPGLSGLGLLRFIRTSPILFALPFVFLTRHEDNALALSQGATDWLDIKDSHPDILLDRLYKSLKIHHGI